MSTDDPKPATPITQVCPLCGTIETNVVLTQGWINWKQGMLIQRAMPEVSECIREFLMTGLCESCRAETDAATEAMEQDDDGWEDVPAF